jgi:hypothetical protein
MSDKVKDFEDLDSGYGSLHMHCKEIGITLQNSMLPILEHLSTYILPWLKFEQKYFTLINKNLHTMDLLPNYLLCGQNYNFVPFASFKNYRKKLKNETVLQRVNNFVK